MRRRAEQVLNHKKPSRALDEKEPCRVSAVKTLWASAGTPSRGAPPMLRHSEDEIVLVDADTHPDELVAVLGGVAVTPILTR